MSLIDSGDIKTWLTGNKKHCEATLPELLSRLILASSASIEEIDFPSGDNTVIGGWDGRLQSSSGSAFFPAGGSAWEIGTEVSPGKKAEDDYTKRTKNPLGVDPKSTTFIFVTPRPWKDRTDWEAKKKATHKWADVKVIGVDKLVLWLSTTPAVALWLARQIKRLSGGIQDIEGFWEEWSAGTAPEITPAVVIGGRAAEVSLIHQWITRIPDLLEIQGDSPDEPKAFLYAALTELPETEKLRVLSRCVVVENVQQFKDCSANFKNLTIVAPADCREVAHLAVRNGHHVFLSADAQSVDIRGKVIRLSRPKRNVIEKKFLENGVSGVQSQKLARDFGRSIPVLHRQLSSTSASQPAWAAPDKADLLFPALFAGSWDENKEGDRRILETLSGVKYEEYSKKLEKLLRVDDTPIRKSGSVWMIKAPLDTWELLVPNLSESFLKLFKKSLLSVLTKTDPKYRLAADKRWAAAVYGKVSPYSEWIQTGLVESLVLLAVHSDHCPHISSAQAFADRIVEEVLTRASSWEIWASLSDMTPLLSEAAPDAFLQGLTRAIETRPEVFKELMNDESGIFGECKHSGLLWALESTAWDSEYLGDSAGILLKLAQIDQGGGYSNRPLNSLKDIFRPAYPQTCATPQERIGVFEKLVSLNPKLTWDFAKGYFSPESFSESHRFRWRETGNPRRGLERENGVEHQEYIKGLLPKMIDVASAEENLATSMDDFIRLPIEIQERLLEVIEKESLKSLPKEKALELFKNTRDTLHWINTYGDGEVKKFLPALNQVLEKVTPKDTLERLGWLVNNPWPELPEGDSKEYDEKTLIITKAREKAMREILDDVSLKKIIEYACGISYQGVFGQALGKIIRNAKEDAIVLDAILKVSSKHPMLLESYAQGRIQTTNEKWIGRQVKRMKAKGNYSADGEALLYSGLPASRAIWSLVSGRGIEVEAAYWDHATGYFQGDSAEDTAFAVEKLIDAKRPFSALSIAGDHKISLPSILLQRLLQEVLLVDSKHKDFRRGGSLDEYHLGNVFRQLQERDELSLEEMVKLEWPFAAFFHSLEKHGSPLAVHRLLQKDPSFFVELVSYGYKQDDHIGKPTGKKKKSSPFLAKNAWEVLHSWHLIPGMQKDGSFNEKEFSEWIEAARDECASKKYVTGGDLQIGLMLANAPSGSDGHWPHEAVRDLLEKLGNEIIERHIQTGLYNSRGVVSRAMDAGGEPERALAEKYKKMSGALKVKWPRVARMLRQMAGNYERDAKREDIDTDIRDFRWD